jgi:RNA polymerase-binding transcription factor DksA
MSTDPTHHRSRLLELEHQVRTRLGHERAASVGEGGRLDPDSEEQATQIGPIEVDDLLLENARLELLRIRAALDRLDAGIYGVCATCEERIAEARLQAVPFAIHCLACAERTGAA